MKEQSSTLLSGKSMKRKKAFFSISAVAKMFSVHQQTIRFYEREGLIAPKRSEGNTRLFSEEDVDKLEEIIYLTHKLGINLAGVQMVLKLQKQVKKMQKDMNQIFDDTHRDLTKTEISHKEEAHTAAEQLAKLKTAGTLPEQDEIAPTVLDDKWEIEYDED